MKEFYFSLQFNVCACILLLCRGNFSLVAKGGGEGAWASFTV